MTGIINLFYLILFFGVSAVGLYICYHILRYSLSRKTAITSVILFASVFLFFLTANAISFFRVDWDELFRSASAFPSVGPTYSGF
ncbi:MAG: hypothetical protein HGB34_00250 [Candidatus Moranbacteria bacterium]|nr:hypothetical protein [Candidatus Moranbacteria bacterium]NTW75326.1 hypothetical protein [Candidatus Moranbacteria bacterium]